MTGRYAAVDLGAESGRVMVGVLHDGKLTLDEVHRFPNNSVRVNGTLRWDVLRLWDEIKLGLRKAAAGGRLDGVSADTWGVDYVWLRGNEPMVTLPYHYRDVRTDDGFERARKLVSDQEIFAETGIQFMTLNTLYQLLHDRQERADVMEFADRFLFIADYFNWLLSGVPKTEESLASTSQLYSPRTRGWSKPLLRKLKLPEAKFPEVVPSATVLGAVLPEVADEVGLPADVKVVATCSHDTGAAVAAVPGRGGNWAYLSSGTWSLLGVESTVPLLEEPARLANFTNELGCGGTVRFLKNIVGLWILQECRRSWQRAGQDLNYDQITAAAAAAEPLRSLIRPDDPRFAKPDDMPEKIQAFCRETGQPLPETPGQFARCILESLALYYVMTLEALERLTGRSLTELHIVGGGSKNALLNQFAANATGRTVHAGPVEATAVGNVLLQALALGHLTDHAALRDVVRNSFDVQTFVPADAPVWQAARARFNDMGQTVGVA